MNWRVGWSAPLGLSDLRGRDERSLGIFAGKMRRPLTSVSETGKRGGAWILGFGSNVPGSQKGQ